MSLTTKTLGYGVLACNLPRGHADRGKVAEAAQETAEVEAPHAAQAAQAAEGRMVCRRQWEGRKGDNPLHPLEIPEQRAYRSQVDDADVR